MNHHASGFNPGFVTFVGTRVGQFAVGFKHGPYDVHKRISSIYLGLYIPFQKFNMLELIL